MAETCQIKGSLGIIQVWTSVCTTIMVDDTIHVKLVPYLTFFFSELHLPFHMTSITGQSFINIYESPSSSSLRPIIPYSKLHFCSTALECLPGRNASAINLLTMKNSWRKETGILLQLWNTSWNLFVLSSSSIDSTQTLPDGNDGNELNRTEATIVQGHTNENVTNLPLLSNNQSPEESGTLTIPQHSFMLHHITQNDLLHLHVSVQVKKGKHMKQVMILLSTSHCSHTIHRCRDSWAVIGYQRSCFAAASSTGSWDRSSISSICHTVCHPTSWHMHC